MVAVAVEGTIADGSAVVFLMLPGVVAVAEMVIMLSSFLVAQYNLLEDTVGTIPSVFHPDNLSKA